MMTLVFKVIPYLIACILKGDKIKPIIHSILDLIFMAIGS